jgi:site-specific recombinase XerD
MSERVMKALMVRVADRSKGWVFPSKRSRSGHIETVEKQFLDARGKAGLGDDVVLYSARHTFCTYALEETGNLAALMKVAGHADVNTAMKYQHPEMSSIREAIERRNQCHNSRHSPAENDGKWLN